MILVLTAVLYCWNIGSSGFSDYYATAAKSMSMSWRAFFFGAFDPTATITIDKLAGFLVPQALSARLFGFSAVSLALPQVIEGLVTVLVSFVVIRRWTNPVIGLFGAAAMALTPLLVSMFSHTMEDGLLLMCSMLAIWAWQRCLDTGRSGFLYLAAVFIGIAFQAKMMQAWLIVPPLAVVFFLLVEQPVSRRLRTLFFAGVITMVVSISWMAAISLFPAGSRPYIDGTINNNIFTMVFGYNGVNRFVHGLLPGGLELETGVGAGAGTATNAVSGPTSATGSGLLGAIANHTPVKFFLPQYATQIGWLYPLAAAGLILGLIAFRHWSKPLNAEDRGLRAAWLLSGAILVTAGAVMSVINFPHTAYIASLSFSLTVLSAIGIVLLWRSTRQRDSRLRYALPVVAAVQTVWTLILFGSYSWFAGAAIIPVGLVGIAATVLSVIAAAGGDKHRRLAIVAAAAALAVGFSGSVVWSLSTLNPSLAGTANEAYAGPPQPTLATRVQNSNPLYGTGLNSNRVSPASAALEAKAYAYTRAHDRAGTYSLATDTWRSAAPLIMNGAGRILPLGGYSSRIPTPTVLRVQELVATGNLHYVLITSPLSKTGVNTPVLFGIQQWVRNTCRSVPQSAFDPSSVPASPWMLPIDVLYDCAR